MYVFVYVTDGSTNVETMIRCRLGAGQVPLYIELHALELESEFIEQNGHVHREVPAYLSLSVCPDLLLLR